VIWILHRVTEQPEAFRGDQLWRTPLLRDWVNSRFPRLARSFTEWQHRGNEEERSRLRLTVEVRTYRHGLPRTYTY
jgi:hypothetical protein